MENFIELINSIFNIEYTFFNIMLVYLIIKIICHMLKKYNKSCNITTNYKKIITFIISVFSGILFYYITELKTETILCSAMLSVVAYDYIVKIILDKLNIK